MKKSKYYFTAIGIAVGTVFAAGILIPAFALTSNTLFIPFIGIGTVLGLIIGSAIDKSKEKQLKEEKKENSK